MAFNEEDWFMGFQLRKRISTFCVALSVSVSAEGLIGNPHAKSALILPHWESFEDGVANDFMRVSGDWFLTTEGTQTYGSAYGNSLSRSVVGDAEWSNYAVESKVRVNYWGDSTAHAVGLLGRFQDEGNYYLFIYEAPGALRIKKKINGELTTLKSRSYTFNANRWYSFRAEMNGSTLRFYVDGKLELEEQDTTSEFTRGKAGLISVYGSSRFDDLRFLNLDAPAGKIIGSALDDLGTFRTVIEGNTSITTTTSPVRRGTHSFKHVTAGHPKRAEIDDNRWNKFDAKTNSYYYGLSYFIPDDGTFSNTLRQFVGQWRFSNIFGAGFTKRNCEMSGHGGSGHHLMLENGQWHYSVQHQDPTKAPCEGLLVKSFNLKPFKRGVWTDVVVHAKYRHTPDGFIKIWIAEDGGGYTQVLDYNGITWLDKYQEGSSAAGKEVKAPNFTFGQYWSNSTEQHINYTDQARVYQVESALDDFRTGFNMVRPEQ